MYKESREEPWGSFAGEARPVGSLKFNAYEFLIFLCILRPPIKIR